MTLKQHNLEISTKYYKYEIHEFCYRAVKYVNNYVVLLGPS
jgi:hypothetical protein